MPGDEVLETPDWYVAAALLLAALYVVRGNFRAVFELAKINFVAKLQSATIFRLLALFAWC